MELAQDYKRRWDCLRSRFAEVLEQCLPRHKRLLHEMEGDIEMVPNILIYGVYGFPHELLWKEGLRVRFGVDKFSPTSCTWGKELQYMETPYYIHIDLDNPYIPKEVEFFQDFLKSVITTRSILSARHVIVLENIDAMVQRCSSMNAFRVFLERFSKNVWFICTTYHISKIEPPLRSRFHGIRVPLPTEEENHAILKMLDGDGAAPAAASPAAATRNLLLAIAVPPYADEYRAWMSSLTYPPLADFMLNTPASALTIEGIRSVIYKAFQCGVSLSALAMDIIETCKRRGDSDEDLFLITRELAHYEHTSFQSKGMRALLYMEYMLHYAVLIVPNKKKR